MKLNLPILFLLVLSSLSLKAQDIHFSQFYLSPLNLNPALTGVMNCNSRITANYRNQWASILKANAFSTYSVSYDTKIPVGRYDYWGIGGTFWGDRAGSSEFQTLQARLSGSYAKRMGGYRQKSHYLVAGMDAGVSQRSIDPGRLLWGSQWDGRGGGDPNLPSGEAIFRDNFMFMDLNAGLLWFSTWDAETNFYIGGAFHHINRANVTFYDNSQFSAPLYSRITGHAGGEFMLTDRIGMVPGVITMFQGPSWQLNTGTSVKFLLGNSRFNHQAFHLGTWVRVANRPNGQLVDAAILSTRFDNNNFTLGFSYDVNLSSLQAVSNNNGAFEFALQYKLCGNERRGVYCPNF
jgi:type IX secretion system PorP/SprF family membrane protein